MATVFGQRRSPIQPLVRVTAVVSSAVGTHLIRNDKRLPVEVPHRARCQLILAVDVHIYAFRMLVFIVERKFLHKEIVNDGVDVQLLVGFRVVAVSRFCSIASILSLWH